MRSHVKAEAVERAGRKILHKHVAGFDKRAENLKPGRLLEVERDRSLVVIEHGEIEAVRARDVAKLAARDVARTGLLHLDDVGAEPRQELGAARTGLHMRDVQDSHAIEGHRHLARPSASSWNRVRFNCVYKIQHVDTICPIFSGGVGWLSNPGLLYVLDSY